MANKMPRKSKANKSRNLFIQMLTRGQGRTHQIHRLQFTLPCWSGRSDLFRAVWSLVPSSHFDTYPDCGRVPWMRMFIQTVLVFTVKHTHVACYTCLITETETFWPFTLTLIQGCFNTIKIIRIFYSLLQLSSNALYCTCFSYIYCLVRF